MFNTRIFIILIVVLVLILSALVVDGRSLTVRNEKFTKLQMCRESCLGKFLNPSVTSKYEIIDKCLTVNNPDCFMCYDYCGLLFMESKTIISMMCGDDVCVSVLLNCKKPICLFIKLKNIPYYEILRILIKYFHFVYSLAVVIMPVNSIADSLKQDQENWK